MSRPTLKEPRQAQNQREPSGSDASTAGTRRPGWITVVILLAVLSAAQDLWGIPRRLTSAPAEVAFALVQSGLYLASAVGLWRMRRWGAICFVAGTLIAYFRRMPLFLAATQGYMGSMGFWLVEALGLVFYALIFRAWLRMARQHQLT